MGPAMIVENAVRQRLTAGELVLGFGVSHLRGAAVAQMARTAGYDWLSIDMEHGAITLDQAAQICLSALPVGIAPLVRIGAGAFGDGTRALDNGAQGLIIPQVESAAEARRIAEAFRYPPAGRRGWGGTVPHLRYAGGAVGEMQALINRETLLVLVIETPEAVAQADAIAAVDGIDVLLVGASDLSTQLGIPGRFEAPAVEAAFTAVATACRRHGKVLGMGGVYDEQWARRYMALGARFVAGGADHGFIMSAASGRSRFLRSLAAAV